MLGNLSLIVKILISILIISVVMLLGSWYSGTKMEEVATAYSGLIDRDAVASEENIRINTRLVAFSRMTYSTALDPNSSQNGQAQQGLSKLIGEIETRKKTVYSLLPDRKSDLDSLYAGLDNSLAVCQSSFDAAIKASSAEDMLAVGERIRQECEPSVMATQERMAKFNRDLSDNRKARSAALAQDVVSTSHTVLAVNIIGLLVGIGVLLMISVSGITRPLSRLGGVMAELASGRLDVLVPYTQQKDEIGQMSRTVLVFQTNAKEVEHLRADQERQKQEAAKAQKAALNRMADDFETRVMDVVRVVSSSSTELQATAQSMTLGATHTSEQARAVLEASDRASANVQTVATATEELSASIQEISRQVAQAATISATAADEANRTNAMVRELASAADKIGEVVNLINDIAAQTNLLALNATIEAARAGEAGKGFAVVANEVKHLANQTGKATEEIRQQIQNVQEETHRAVEAIGGIGSVVGQMNEISAGIASAVEEQGAATQEIARNVQEAAQGTQDVAGNIGGVTEAAETSGAAAQQVLEAAGDLAQNADRLRVEVETFLRTVRAN